MKKVTTQISYFDNKNINDLPEKIITARKKDFERIQSLIKCEKLSFTKISSEKCEANKQPSSELLFEIINPLVNLKEEQLFFVLSCILSEKVSIFPPNDESVKQAFEDLKLSVWNNFKFSLDDNEIIDLLDLLDSELNNLAKEVDLNFPFTCIVDEKNYFLFNYSTNLMYKLTNTNLLTNLYNSVKQRNINMSQKRLEVENSEDELILLSIKNKKYFVITPFPRQGSTRSITLIMQKVRDSIQKKENIEIEAFLLPNFSSVVSVIPYNDNLYYTLNDFTTFEKKSIPILNFIAVGHKTSFVLKSMILKQIFQVI